MHDFFMFIGFVREDVWIVDGVFLYVEMEWCAIFNAKREVICSFFLAEVKKERITISIPHHHIIAIHSPKGSLTFFKFYHYAWRTSVKHDVTL